MDLEDASCPKMFMTKWSSMDQNNTRIICDCLPKYLYFPLKDACYQAYRRGPCKYGEYFVPLEYDDDEMEVTCQVNPCRIDGQVLFEDNCVQIGCSGSCDNNNPNRAVTVNPMTFALECTDSVVVPFIGTRIDSYNSSSKCPYKGSKRNMLKICKRVV